MNKVIVWGAFGSILRTFDSEVDAEEWIDDCDYAEIYRDTNGGDVNIMVAEGF